MKILFAAAEVAPLTKVGGLADVVRSLPGELIKRGHEVRIIVPKYGFADYKQYSPVSVIDSYTVLSLNKYHKIAVEQIAIDDIPVYLVSGDLFEKSVMVYGEDEIEKFWLFCDCVSEIVHYLDWKPSIVHCHDWHTSLIPLLARKNHDNYRTVFTIHNIKYQGYFDEQILSRSDLGYYWGRGIPGMIYLPWNLIAQGIIWSDVINTVSETFAREILTPEHGYGMQKILEFRKDALHGIRNGLGFEEYEPLSDKLIPAIYSSQSQDGKIINKKELQKLAGWEADETIPMVGMVSRLDEQKGMDLILGAIPEILSKENVQFTFLGRGNAYYEDALRRLELNYPHSVKAFIAFDNAIAHLLYAGSDMFLMPSKWEPCGLGQMIAMRYGTVPIVRKTGGLADTVTNISTGLKSGSGFVFNEYSVSELVSALSTATESFRNKAGWKSLIKRIMVQDFSWSKPAAEYELLYKKVSGL